MKTKFTLLGGAALLAFAGMSAATPVQAKESWGKGAPEFSDPDGNIKFKVRGRLMMDAVSYEQDLDTLDGADADLVPEGDLDSFQTRARRARIGVEGQLDSKWKYKAEVTLLPRAGGSNVEWEDLFLEYNGGFGSLIVGNQKVGSPLEEATSSRFISQMERSFLSGTFGFGRAMGVGAIFGGNTNWSVATFVNTDSLNSNDISVADEANVPDEVLTYLVHGHWAPIAEPTKVLHLGGTLRMRDSGAVRSGVTNAAAAGTLLGYSSRAGTNVGNNAVTTGAAYDEDMFYGVEAATIMGPFWASAEYGMLTAERFDGSDNDFTSYNLQAGWFLTGESRGYKKKSGEFDRTTPNAPVYEGGMGAWELRGRYDFIDLTDGSGASAVYGGEATSYTVGVNWSPAKNVRFMGEYVSTEVEENRLAVLPGTSTADGNGDFEVIQFRAQFDF